MSGRVSTGTFYHILTLLGSYILRFVETSVWSLFYGFRVYACLKTRLFTETTNQSYDFHRSYSQISVPTNSFSKHLLRDRLPGFVHTHKTEHYYR